MFCFAVYKVNILSRREEGHFVKYSATILDLYKRGLCPIFNPFNYFTQNKICLVETNEAVDKKQESNLVIS